MKTIKEYNAFEIANWYGCKELTDKDKFLKKEDVVGLIADKIKMYADERLRKKVPNTPK